MVRRLLKLVRKDRLARFAEVWRTEGRKAALRAAWRHGKMGLQGHVPSVVTETPAPKAEGCALSSIWTELAQKNAFFVTDPPYVHRKRRHVAMIGDLNLPQCRKYRVEQLDELWAQAGIGYSYAHYEDIPRAIDQMQTATHLMLYRLGTSPLSEMYLYEARRLRLPVIYDIDDPLFSFATYETYSNGEAIPPEIRRRLIDQAPSYFAVMQQADVLTLSTPGLVDEARRMSTRPAFLRRNFADHLTLSAGRHVPPKRPDRDQFTVTFASGSLGHEVDFLTIADEVEGFILEKPGRRLQILGRFDMARLPRALATRTEIDPFADYAAYLKSLSRSDCSILPLADDAFNRCKSAVRVIDAASVGVPSIVSPVGDGSAMVRDGATGKIAQKGGWYEALDALARDPDRTADIGRSAREDLERRWSAQTAMPVIDPRFFADVMA